MNLPNIEVEKSKIPIVWLDTSVIINITIFKENPNKLQEPQRSRIELLYKLVLEYSQAGKIICPLADQEGEVWINRKEWMNTIRELSLGIECLSLKEIQDKQLHKAMNSYFLKEESIVLSYLDAFDSDPAEEMRDVLREGMFLTIESDIFLGADFRRETNDTTLKLLNEQREKNVALGINFETQFLSEVDGEIKEIIKMAHELQNGEAGNEREAFNKLGASINLHQQLHAWEHITGQKNDIDGLISFYSSSYNINCPYVDLSCSLTAKIMIDPQPIKSSDPIDINHISTLMPFSDLFITDKPWRTYINNRGYDKKYGTNVHYIGDTDAINKFFEGIE